MTPGIVNVDLSMGLPRRRGESQAFTAVILVGYGEK